MAVSEILTRFGEVSADPLGYARAWKARSGQPVIGSFPMNFPSEMAHAAGALPVIIQESDDPITVGHGLLFPFYCGFTRSAVDQAGKGDLAVLDAIMFGDHCVQLLGAADAVRVALPETRVIFFQLISSMCDPWTFGRAKESFEKLRSELEDFLGRPVEDEAMRASIRLFNRNRALIRQLYQMRVDGRASLTASQMQSVVKSSMVMDRREHTDLLEALLAAIPHEPAARDSRAIRLHLSGHFCQAPKPELLDMIEGCGAVVVGDDLYHGFRFISTDVPEEGDPMDGLARWYMDRNTGVPCPTRVQNDVDWDAFLIDAMRRQSAEGMIVLMAKFCEPHMYYYPEVKEAFERAEMPHLLIETEHESMALEHIRTRVESFLELVKRRRGVARPSVRSMEGEAA
ncbi:2-hydroxyacyl-CoA dehydratase family protein [Tsuneonella sp. CC-YZS046]|uniref:2-hydroxyacyl-CoA dehydratase subunit D n=1 Tax=Tsuneonella sp. CC-YZS046 TaxID=3042152 RepID=UPI002D787E7A|nr:2-hydroxyacyl-CoA dehydratase family protein [Tsuneonella sp. CC-YZS046]WRO65339.1 2-hydroxyacyl-CoA dehydratase family protein [Tsuneonella sp. CC-YZS046]